MIGINSGDSVLDDFLVSIRSYQLEIANFANNVKSIDEYFVPFEMCCISICDNFKGLLMRYIPYYQFTNVKEITKGGFSIVYQATRLNGSKKNIYRFLTRDNIVILKRFKNSQFAEKYFMNELKINHHYGSYETIIKTHDYISKEFELGIVTARCFEYSSNRDRNSNVSSIKMIDMNYVDGVFLPENIRESAKSESRGESVANRSKVEKNWRILDEAIVISYSVFRLLRIEFNKNLELPLL
ncbi:hypothetical protein RhiirA1_442799 [Rhizophagus irregularis]|uniref:Protein kinase domain-containing protein n=1 Tax=Rhizophagus irregularis TaxID=588596 RepID=A0A2N0RMJ0_9GLOM|nr:hypothetical protein RhiirA1_442799 [Rhizophagus irregularis]